MRTKEQTAKLHPDEQRQLVHRCLARDRSAWDELVQRFSNLIYFAICHTAKRYRLQFDSATVDDLHNTVFFRLLQNEAKRLRQFSGRCSLANWLKVIAVNTTIDFVRKKRALLVIDDEQFRPGATALSQELISPSPELAYLDHEQLRRLDFAVGKLSPSDQLLVRLLFVDGLSNAEAAQVIRSSVGAVYARKHRLIKRLKALVETGDDLGNPTGDVIDVDPSDHRKTNG